MEKKLFLLLLFTGVLPPALPVRHKYYLIQQPKKWSDAQAYCRSTYADLATIETSSDVAQIQNEAQKYQFSSSAWVGLSTDINSWRWSFGNDSLNWKDWDSTEPDNWMGHEECAGTNQWNWFDAPCLVNFPFLCFNGSSITSTSLSYYSNPKTWPEAQKFCRQFHTDLASPKDSNENTVMQNYLLLYASTSKHIWFGLFRDSWKWSDQTPFSSVRWIPGQPDNAAPNENCGYVSNGLAGDAPCSVTYPFFCYKVVMAMQQLVRVKVLSDQDVNDPTVKEMILQQINQKLKEAGMETVKVRWREQPGGVVFQKVKETSTAAAAAQNPTA